MAREPVSWPVRCNFEIHIWVVELGGGVSASTQAIVNSTIRSPHRAH